MPRPLGKGTTIQFVVEPEGQRRAEVYLKAKLTKDYKGRPLREEFVEVVDCYRVEERLKDGAEIYSLLLVPREIKTVQRFFDLGGGRRWIRDD